MPTWRGLVSVPVDGLHPADAGDDRRRSELLRQAGATNTALRLADEFVATFGRSALQKLIPPTTPDDFAPGRRHRLPVELPWTDILTTNHDTLLERAAASESGQRYASARTRPARARDSSLVCQVRRAGRGPGGSPRPPPAGPAPDRNPEHRGPAREGGPGPPPELGERREPGEPEQVGQWPPGCRPPRTGGPGRTPRGARPRCPPRRTRPGPGRTSTTPRRGAHNGFRWSMFHRRLALSRVRCRAVRPRTPPGPNALPR